MFLTKKIMVLVYWCIFLVHLPGTHLGRHPEPCACCIVRTTTHTIRASITLTTTTTHDYYNLSQHNLSRDFYGACANNQQLSTHPYNESNHLHIPMMSVHTVSQL